MDTSQAAVANADFSKVPDFYLILTDQLGILCGAHLDLGLPDGDGLTLLREIRNRDNPTPVLVLTARRPQRRSKLHHSSAPTARSSPVPPRPAS
jgi:DNA-binding NarL/FixJ family response regulator